VVRLYLYIVNETEGITKDNGEVMERMLKRLEKEDNIK
jgi:hypothetical protein